MKMDKLDETSQVNTTSDSLWVSLKKELSKIQKRNVIYLSVSFETN